MNEEKRERFLHIILPLIIAVVSFFILSGLVGSSHWIDKYLTAIDTSRQTTLKLLASSAASSAAITMLPGDAASPIATELAELSEALMIVLCALYLEKFNLIISSSLVFKILVPFACVSYCIGNVMRKEILKSVGVRVFAFAVAFLLLVPVSLELSTSIQDVYQSTIDETIRSAEESTDTIQENTDSDSGSADSDDILGNILNGLKSIGGTIANGISSTASFFEKLLSGFVESVAIMIVVTCLIPVLVIWLFALIVKALFNFNTFSPSQRIELPGKFIKAEMEKPDLEAFGNAVKDRLQKPDFDAFKDAFKNENQKPKR